MKIITAMRYANKTMLRIVFNPNDPEWIHIVGAPRLDADGGPILDDAGAPILIESPDVPVGDTGDTEQAKEPGRTLCHNCTTNWDIVEYSWIGSDQFKSVDGERVDKTPEDFESELIERIHAEATQLADVPGLLDKTITLDNRA